MSKTFYADGQTGKVAIMKGEFSQTVLDNPRANTDKLYFHSDLDYLYKIGEMSGTFSFKAVSGINRAAKLVASVPFDASLRPVVFMYLNGFPLLNPKLVHYDYATAINAIINERFIGGLYSLSSGWLNLYAYTMYVATNIPSYTGTLSAKIFAYQPTFNGTENLLITPTTCIFNKGKFKNDKDYLKAGNATNGFPLYNSAAFSFPYVNNVFRVNEETPTVAGWLNI